MDSDATQHITPEVVRAAVYLEAMERADRGFKPSGKTRKGVKCAAPNKKCGNRCIPPKWNCRLTGGGLDSHSKVLQFDPVSGTNNLVRGVSNVIQGTRKADPELLTRGIKGVERGVVKLTPGQSKDEKERLRQKVQTVGAVAFTAILTGIAIHKTHGFFNNFKWYREGVGKKVDSAARTAVDSVMDTWDVGVNQVGLTSMVSGRTVIRGQAARTASLLGRQARIRDVTLNRLGQQPRDNTFLANRALLRTSGKPGTGALLLGSIDAEARNNNWTRAQWEAKKAEALFSQRSGGLSKEDYSVFSHPAAHEYLAAQWGFKMPQGRAVREAQTVAEIQEVKQLLRTAVKDTHKTLVTDMDRRGIPKTTEGIGKYIDTLMEENPTLIPKVTSQREQRKLTQEFKQNMRTLLGMRSPQEQASYAADIYRNTVSMYDDYFTSIAKTLEVDPKTRRFRLHPTKPDSAAGVAEHGLARLHFAKGRIAVRPRDRTGASFLNGYYFDQVVKRNRGLYQIASTQDAIKYANSLSSQPIRTVAEAEDWFKRNNLRVHIPKPRELFRPDALEDKQMPIRFRGYVLGLKDTSGPR